MSMHILPLLTAATLMVSAPAVQAFCGFYVAKADTKLFNEASQVCLVRDGHRTVMTMANDFQGDLKEFAVVIPVPTVIDKKDVQVVEKALLDHLDAYSAPRLVEYWDSDPNESYAAKAVQPMSPALGGRAEYKPTDGARSLGVKIERKFSVGEYDILVLSADQSSGLAIWLKENGYRIPDGAEDVLGSYIKQNVKFFVAKVNLEEQAKTGRTWLRPLRVEFSTRKFMLPIRLGAANAKGHQDLFIYTLTKKGRVETTNYRVKRLPSDIDVPEFVAAEFPRFYRDFFDRVTQIEDMQSVITEYAWDMGWCDPCAADPVPNSELRKLGVGWVKGEDAARPEPEEVFITRLHVRYDLKHFPEDLVFQETGDQTNFQGRYIIRHPWRGKITTDDGRAYMKGLPARVEKENQNLARLTGWGIEEIRGKVEKYVPPKKKEE
ncbi:MAG: DUF2330 domain-containing protein [Verrucomicrobium sp.]|nr:DUF2330 domain-containing protein [Verrucomicrobium sp.]